MDKVKQFLSHRTTAYLLLASVFLVLAFVAANVELPAFIQVALYKGFLLFAAAHAGYWIDRVVFYYARPDQLLLEQQLVDELDLKQSADGDYIDVHGISLHSAGQTFDTATIRRAIIIAAAMVCVAFGA